METSAFRPKDKRVASRSSEESYAGPGLADSSLITLPITPSPPRPLAKRVRRTRGLSEDEPPQNDDDEIRNEEYRTGGPLLVNLPAITEAVPQDSPLVVAWISGLKAATIDLLRAHSIEWKELTINKRQDSHVPEETTAATAETIFIMATKRAGQDWRAVCRDIRSCCVAYDLHDTNVEIADARGLTVAESFGVDTSEPIYKAWPALKRKVIEILGLRRWLALELLRRGKGATAAENPTTIVITIDYSSQLNWTDVREQIVELLEVNDFAEVAVEIGRGSICRSAQKDTKFLSEDAYQMKARMGTSMGPSGNIKRAGTFGCYVRLQSSKNNIWHTFGLTCHHVMLPSSSNHQLQDLWDRHGIMPSEEASKLKLDMPSLLDHLDTMKTYKDVIQSRETEDHKSVRRRVQDPDDFVPLYQSKAFERDEKFIVERKTVVRTAENFFESGSEQLGSVFASSGLCLSRSSNASVDWALLEMNPTRASINYVSSSMDGFLFLTDIYIQSFHPLLRPLISSSFILVQSQRP